MKITTPQGTTFNTSLPAKSNLCMVLVGSGKRVMDRLHLTGKFTQVEEDQQPIYMMEVETSFGVTEINENYIWQ